MKRLPSLIVALLLATASMVSWAEEPWPSRPIIMVYPFAMGGADVLARAMASAISSELKQPVVLDPKPGAGGSIGGAVAARAKPDGYTILYSTSTVSVGVTELFKNPTYKPLEQHTPIAYVGDFTTWLFVRPDLPVKDYKEFVAYAASHPGDVTVAAGNATTRILTTFMENEAKIKVNMIPYKSDPEMMTDVMAGRIDALWGTGQWVELVKNGKLKALVVSSSTRHPDTPDVPTRSEVGMKPMPVSTFVGLAGPAGMPKPMVERLNKIINEAKKKDPEMKRAMKFLRVAEGPDLTPEEFKARWQQDAAQWKVAVPAAGIERQ